MRKLIWITCVGATVGALLWAADWPSSSGNPQRDGWSRGEKALSRESAAARKIELLYKYKFDNQAKGMQALTQPIILSNIIGYMGFKELLFIGGSADTVYSIDSDLGKAYFKTQLPPLQPVAKDTSSLCGEGLTADLAMAGSSGAGRRGGGGQAPPPAAGRAAAPPAVPGAPAVGAVPGAAPGAAPARAGGGGGGGGGGGRGGPAVFWAVSSDGFLRTLRQQDGDAQWIPPAKFVPAGAHVTGLNVNANTIYAATSFGCSGTPNGLYAADYTPPQMGPTPGLPLVAPASFKVTEFLTNGSGFAGTGGTAISNDGRVFGQIAEGRGDVAGTYSDTVLAMEPKSLVVKDYFTPAGSRPALKKGVASAGTTPLIFTWNDKEVVVVAGRDGRLYLLDSNSLGGADHHTPLAQSDVIVTPDSQYSGAGIWGSMATFEDAANGNTRWIYASIRGSAATEFPASYGTAASGAVVAFKLQDRGGQPSLLPQWISREMLSPASPATANGLVFALSTGESPRVAKADGTPYTASEMEKMAKAATLYILDGATGKELFSSGNAATSFAHSGLAVANGRVYFSTHDNTLYAYGVAVEH